MAEFPKSVVEVIETLSEMFRHQGQTELVDLLANAHARFDETDFDNWNGGTYTWALRLEIAVPLFASVEPHLSRIEKSISDKLKHIGRLYPNDHIGEVTISPTAPGLPALGVQSAPSELDVRRLWPEGQLRLFLSHVSEHKIAVSTLKRELRLRGISAFIAHEDIEPSLEWQDEIELGLRSMHALAALITPEFHSSKWTDQEVGWALGRNVPVVAVRLGSDPYGLIGKYQWIACSLDEPIPLADSIVNALLVNVKTHSEMKRALVNGFVSAFSFNMAHALRRTIVTITDFSDEEILRLKNACTENDQIAGATGVPEAIYKAFGMPVTPTPTHDDIPF